MKAEERLLLAENGTLKSKLQSGREKKLLRHRLQLLCSFLCGFLIAYTTLIFYDHYLVWSIQVEQHSTNMDYYQTGYMTALKELETNETALHDHLTNSVRVLCMVFTYPKFHRHHAIHIKKTWGRRCTKLLFMSSKTDGELNAIPIVNSADDFYDNLWNKTRESFRYAYEHYLNDYDWFLKADDDTYVIIENLRYMLYAYQPDIPIYFGYQLRLNDVDYMSGGAAYVLSREALKRFMEKSYHNEKICPSGNVIGGEDYLMSFCLQNVGVLLANSKLAVDNDKKTKFLPANLEIFTEPQWNYTIPQWLFDMSTESVDVGMNCCSNFSIAFHYMEPAQLYAMEFLIYHVQAFGYRHRAANLPRKISREKVFRKFSKNISLPIKIPFWHRG